MLLRESEMPTTAVAYYRTSSATNVGSDKDSLKRQREAVVEYAGANDILLVREFYDAAVSGADPIHEREGFAELLAYVAGNGARTVLVENASRFARDLAVQLTGHSMLKELGYELVPVDAPDYFLDETPTAVMVRQILGAVSQFEKAQVVSKLKAARDRKRAETGKCEGRKSYLELNPALIREAKRLRRKNPVTGKRRSYRKISRELEAMGFVNGKGNPFAAAQIKRMVGA
jgi:DNA invertase Pin-like site-specific DNA recombinase